MDQLTPAPKNRSNTLLLALVVLLLISNVVMLYLWNQKGDQAQQAQAQVAAVSSEKENVTKLLEDMLVQYDTLSSENEQLNAEMAAQPAAIGPHQRLKFAKLQGIAERDDHPLGSHRLHEEIGRALAHRPDDSV